MNGQFYELRRETTSEFYDIRRMTVKEQPNLFGRRLREARQLADIPQDRLGVKIGLDEHTASARMSRYETGVHEPPVGIALKLAHALRVPMAYFYCDDEELAGLPLKWWQLSKSDRHSIIVFAQSKLPALSGDAPHCCDRLRWAFERSV